MNVRSIAVMAAAAVLAAGCATQQQGVRVYAGGARAAGEVAQVAAASEFDVKAIDGVKVGQGYFSSARETVFEVLPGPHEIVARFYSPFVNGTTAASTTETLDRSGLQALHLDAVAGRRYAIKRRTENREVVLFIIEDGAATALADVKPMPRRAVMAVLGNQAVPEPTVAPAKTVEPVAEKTVNAPPATAATAPVKDERVEAPKITPLDNLKQWWFYASPQERAAFRAWMDAAK